MVTGYATNSLASYLSTTGTMVAGICDSLNLTMGHFLAKTVR